MNSFKILIGIRTNCKIHTANREHVIRFNFQIFFCVFAFLPFSVFGVSMGSKLSRAVPFCFFFFSVVVHEQQTTTQNISYVRSASQPFTVAIYLIFFILAIQMVLSDIISQPFSVWFIYCLLLFFFSSFVFCVRFSFPVNCVKMLSPQSSSLSTTHSSKFAGDIEQNNALYLSQSVQQSSMEFFSMLSRCRIVFIFSLHNISSDFWFSLLVEIVYRSAKKITKKKKTKETNIRIQMRYVFYHCARARE